MLIIAYLRPPPVSEWKVTINTIIAVIHTLLDCRMATGQRDETMSFMEMLSFGDWLWLGKLRFGETLCSPLYGFILQPHSRTLFSKASGKAIGGFCLRRGH